MLKLMCRVCGDGPVKLAFTVVKERLDFSLLNQKKSVDDLVLYLIAKSMSMTTENN